MIKQSYDVEIYNLDKLIFKDENRYLYYCGEFIEELNNAKIKYEIRYDDGTIKFITYSDDTHLIRHLWDKNTWNRYAEPQPMLGWIKSYPSRMHAQLRNLLG